MKFRLAFSVLAFNLLGACCFVAAADVVLLRDGKSDYQIVVPDKHETPAVAEGVNQTARLVQTAFKANGADVAVVVEKDRDAAKPAIYLGNTIFAKQQSLDVIKLKDWSYVWRVVGQDVIIAGHDQATPLPIDPKTKSCEGMDRFGSTKVASDKCSPPQMPESQKGKS